MKGYSFHGEGISQLRHGGGGGMEVKRNNKDEPFSNKKL